MSEDLDPALHANFLRSSYDDELEILVQAYLHDVHYTSRMQAIFNIFYSLVNAGLLSLPFTCSRSGILIFSFSVIFFSIISGYSTCIVVNMANDQKVRTLEDLGDRAFGARGMYIVSAFQIIFSFSLMCISLSIWSDIMSEVIRSRFGEHFGAPFLPSTRGETLVGGLIILYSCTSTQSMVSLRFTSYFTALAVISALVAVAGSLASDFLSDSSVSNLDITSLFPHKMPWLFLFSIPFCFSFNQKALTVYSCLRRRSYSRWKYCIVRAITALAVIYLIFGNVGYIAQVVHDKSLSGLNYFMDNSNGSSILYDITRYSILFYCLLSNIISANTIIIL